MLIDELRELGSQLGPSEQPASNEVLQLVGALIYYVDTRLNAAPPPPGTDRDPRLPGMGR